MRPWSKCTETKNCRIGRQWSEIGILEFEISEIEEFSVMAKSSYKNGGMQVILIDSKIKTFKF